jgi:hypothetical protein
MSGSRTPEQVEHEIAVEREQLALAVSHLRGELRHATDVRALLRARLPQVVGAVLAAAGLATAMRMLRHRGKRREKAHFGRFTLVERD